MDMRPTTAPPPRREATPDPELLERPLAEIGGDIRDRLAVLLNATEVIRLGVLNQNPDLLFNLRLIEKQVHHLGRLADELDRVRDGHPTVGDGLDGPPHSDSRPGE
jgi:hypothetical protein